MGALMVGLYQHDLPSPGGRNATYIGVFGYETGIFSEKYNYTESHFVRTMVLNYQNKSRYQVMLRNDTRITYLHPNYTSFITLKTTPVSESARVAGFASYSYDYDTNSSFFLHQSPQTNYSQVLLQKFDQNETDQGTAVLPVPVSVGSHLQMDITVADGFVYTAVVSDTGSVYCDHECNGTTKSDIYILKYHNNDLSTVAKLVLSFPGDDIISRIDLNNAAKALQVMWMSTYSGRSTFDSYHFASFEISSIIPQIPRETGLIRENDTISIRFSVPPVELNNGNLSLVPQVYVGRNLARNVQWDPEVLRISIPRGVETSM
ncbi:hypothetical protein BKA69DRAFT_112413 [Paraphysoderma sedebokerense]|nr:hypothetical protein BKA69DRAFT_112413 [Paraphysoderma sedebokerense]